MTALNYKSRRRPVLTLLRDVAEPAPGSARWLADAPDAAHPHGPRVPAAQDAGIRVRYGPAARPLPDAGGETHPRVPAIGELLPASSVPPAICAVRAVGRSGWHGRRAPRRCPDSRRKQQPV